MLADRLIGIIRLIAQPSLVQLVMRLRLAVPFWRSGILKWDGFLQLNDTAVICLPANSCCICRAAPIRYPAPGNHGIYVRMRAKSSFPSSLSSALPRGLQQRDFCS